MKRFDIFALAAAAIVTLLCAGLTRDAFEIYVVMSELTPIMAVAAVLAWIFHTYGPITIAALFWRWAKRGRYAWVLHLLFFPTVYGAIWIGLRMMLFATGSWDFDGTFGAPEMPGALLFLLAVIGYAIALISKLFARQGDRAKVV